MQAKICNKEFIKAVSKLPHQLTIYTAEDLGTNNIPLPKDLTVKMATMPPNKREALQIQTTIALKLSGTNNDKMKRYCPYCWVTQEVCFCDKILPVPKQTPKSAYYRWIVLYHCKEFYRGTNTAKVLLSSVPGTRMYVHGLEEHEKEMHNLFYGKSNTVVLFPSQTALTLDEYLQTKYKPCLDTKDEEDEQTIVDMMQSDTPFINIVLLDGTWGQARHMNLVIPDNVPRIKLSTSMDYVPLFNALRKQSTKGRISTLEAAILCMQEFGENDQVCETLRTNLKTMINQIRTLNRSLKIDFDA